MQDLEAFISNHWQLAYGFAAVLTLLVIVEFLRARRATSMVDTKRAVHLMNRENATVIDTRMNDAFRQGHIIDAVTLSLDDLQQNNKKLERLKNKPVILICNTDAEAQKTAASLAKQGYNSYALAGGIRAWKEAGLPLVKS
jgi:rhodanese-related sulfurtransferase